MAPNLTSDTILDAPQYSQENPSNSWRTMKRSWTGNLKMSKLAFFVNFHLFYQILPLNFNGIIQRLIPPHISKIWFKKKVIFGWQIKVRSLELKSAKMIKTLYDSQMIIWLSNGQFSIFLKLRAAVWYFKEKLPLRWLLKIWTLDLKSDSITKILSDSKILLLLCALVPSGK